MSSVTMADNTSEDSITYPDAATALSQGKRHLLVRDYSMAVTALAQACAKLAEDHGDMSDELGEPFLLYGRALLGLSREEAGVLGTCMPENEEDDDGEEGDEGEDEPAAEEDEKNEKDNKEKDETEKSEKAAESKTEEKKDAPAATSSSSSSSKDVVMTDAANGGPSTSKQNGEASENGDEEDGDDVDDEDEEANSNLQVAWEVLELAKLILVKRGEPGWKLLAEAHRLLGEVAMESGNQAGALTDLSACLDLLRKIEPVDARSMAETHYQLGLAYSLGNEFDSSIEQFQEAVSLLETRIKDLESSETSKSEDATSDIAGEIKELKELLPEIQDKIADMRDFKQQAAKMVIENIKSRMASGSCSNGAGPSGEGSSSSAAGSSSCSKPASDISHLVRKKRKNDEDEPETASPCKKPLTENSAS